MVSAAASDRSLRESNCALAGAAKARPRPTRPTPMARRLVNIVIPPLALANPSGQREAGESNNRETNSRPISPDATGSAYTPAKPGEKTMTRHALLIAGFLVAAYPLSPLQAQQQKVGAPPESSNMRIVRSSDLQ